MLLKLNFIIWFIFKYDAKHLVDSDILYKKEDKSNSSLLKEYDPFKFQMSISSDLYKPQNFITKISYYNKVVNISNNITIFDELLPIYIEMAKRNLNV
ncbi:hypothetical protein GQ457_15G016770 [Hibiscus cannabinus]